MHNSDGHSDQQLENSVPFFLEGPSAQLLPPPTTSLLAARRPWYQLLNHLSPNLHQVLAKVLPLQKMISLNQISLINAEKYILTKALP
ncbi:hypothetical protein CapIbe_011619 [Capra ibex]